MRITRRIGRSAYGPRSMGWSEEWARSMHCNGIYLCEFALLRGPRTAGQFDPARPFQVFVQLFSSLF
jgi:hypothetical protein